MKVQPKLLLLKFLLNFVASGALFFLFCCCPLNAGKTPETPLEYLQQNFGGEFSNPREIKPDLAERRYQWENYEKYIKYYSSKLQKDIVVAQYLRKNGKNYSYDFNSNYMFVKYEKKFDFFGEMALKDFSDVQIIYDLDWMFTGYTEKNTPGEDEVKTSFVFRAKDHTSYMIINTTEEKYNELEYRLKSLTYRINEIEDYGHATYYFITTPQSRAAHNIDYSNITVDDLYKNDTVISSFIKIYKKSGNNCYFRQVEKTEEE